MPAHASCLISKKITLIKLTWLHQGIIDIISIIPWLHIHYLSHYIDRLSGPICNELAFGSRNLVYRATFSWLLLWVVIVDRIANFRLVGGLSLDVI